MLRAVKSIIRSIPEENRTAVISFFAFLSIYWPVPVLLAVTAIILETICDVFSWIGRSVADAWHQSVLRREAKAQAPARNAHRPRRRSRVEGEDVRHQDRSGRQPHRHPDAQDRQLQADAW